MKSNKPEVSYIAGMFKSFRYSLKEVHLTSKELIDLYRMIKLAIIPIKDVKHYSVITSNLSITILSMSKCHSLLRLTAINMLAC
jgi:hypothetical protein